MQQFMEIFQEYGLDRYVMISLAIVGVLLLTMGYRLFHVSVNLLGFVISGGVFAGFMYYMFQPAVIMLAVIFLLSGIFGAFFASYMYKAGVFMLSGIMGGFIIFWLTHDIILMLAGGLLIAIIAVLVERIFLILLSSLAGSILVASLVEVYTDCSHIIIVGATVIVAVGGMMLQFLTTKSKKKEIEVDVEDEVVEEVVIEDHVQKEVAATSEEIQEVVESVEEESDETAEIMEEIHEDIEPVVEPEIVETQDIVEEEKAAEEK